MIEGVIRQKYDQMIKYTTAICLGTAETEAILRRFTPKNLEHPIKRFWNLAKRSGLSLYANTSEATRYEERSMKG